MARNSDTALAFLLGAVTGGIIALLLAPEKGEVTREKIRRGASDAYDKGRDWVSRTEGDLREKTGELTDRAKEKVQGVTGTARQQLDAVKGAVTEGRDAYRREMEKNS